MLNAIAVGLFCLTQIWLSECDLSRFVHLGGYDNAPISHAFLGAKIPWIKVIFAAISMTCGLLGANFAGYFLHRAAKAERDLTVPFAYYAAFVACCALVGVGVGIAGRIAALG